MYRKLFPARFVVWCVAFGLLMGLAGRVSPAWLRPWVAIVGCLVLLTSWLVTNRSAWRR
jgi:hypothetical protein